MSGTDETGPEGGTRTVHLAGGCFWGLEKAFSVIKGVTDTECGYANGHHLIVPDYMTVCSGKFGYCEAVKVGYDPLVVSLEELLEVFFMVIRPEQQNRQGNDHGIQYRTGIYWTDRITESIVNKFIDNERKKHDDFFTEAEPLVNFFPAEEYHQDYLEKNPDGYCHISSSEIERIRRMFS